MWTYLLAFLVLSYEQFWYESNSDEFISPLANRQQKSLCNSNSRLFSVFTGLVRCCGCMSRDWCKGSWRLAFEDIPATMKSEVPPEATSRQKHLKEPLINPEPMDAAKSFTTNMEVIGKAGSEFETLCESRRLPLRDTGTHKDSERSLPGRRKRKGQQAGPSDCSLKDSHISESSLAPQRPRVELLPHPSEDEHNQESSFSDCASSPSSSLQFGDSDTLSSEEEGDAAATGAQHKAPTLTTVGGTRVGLRPVLGRTRGSRSHKWVRSEAEPVLLKRQCLSSRRPLHRKRFVKAAPGGGQRTQKQKERLLLQRKKREVIARRKYALLHSTSSSSEELSSDSSSPSSTEAEDELYVDVSSTISQPNSSSVATGDYKPHSSCIWIWKQSPFCSRGLQLELLEVR